MDTFVASPFYDFKLKTIEGDEFDFSQLKGKHVLLVNVASRCGYTPQYEDLQGLHEAHGKNLVVLGFPANNFGGQEPGSHQEIADFCKKNYGVTFQMFEKISVVGTDRHPLYTWLAENEPNGGTPSWNFSKYLVDPEGKVLGHFASSVNPLSETIVSHL